MLFLQLCHEMAVHTRFLSDDPSHVLDKSTEPSGNNFPRLQGSAKREHECIKQTQKRGSFSTFSLLLQKVIF